MMLVLIYMAPFFSELCYMGLGAAGLFGASFFFGIAPNHFDCRNKCEGLF